MPKPARQAFTLDIVPVGNQQDMHWRATIGVQGVALVTRTDTLVDLVEWCNQFMLTEAKRHIQVLDNQEA